MKLSIVRRSGSFTALGALFVDGEPKPARPDFLDAGIRSLLAKIREDLECQLIDSSIGDRKSLALKIKPIRASKTRSQYRRHDLEHRLTSILPFLTTNNLSAQLCIAHNEKATLEAQQRADAFMAAHLK